MGHRNIKIHVGDMYIHRSSGIVHIYYYALNAIMYKSFKVTNVSYVLSPGAATKEWII
jgi:hypothetical protein